MQRENPDVWRRKYGLRWIAESAFSWLKRVFGEYVTAKNLKNMIQEITLKGFREKSHIEGIERLYNTTPSNTPDMEFQRKIPYRGN
ncbi:hypothetical protein DRO55_06270 [Candidatus Bathyarchaeota archaeon]|nr:MAG: hypothetical protein DRO55_06270 [Candidatus Bathyarchaeota archaeon]